MERRGHTRVRDFLIGAILAAAAFVSPSHAGHAPADLRAALTDAERAFLEAHPVLRMGVGVAFPPFQFVETENGKPVFKGMVADIVALLGKRLGTRFEPVYGITYKEALERGKRGEIDLYPMIARTPEREAFLTYTKPYIVNPLVIFTRDDAPFIGSVDDLHGKRVATIKALATYSKYVNDLPHVKMDLRLEKDVAGVLTAVSLGNADACVANLAVASYLIRKLGLSNLKVAAPTPWGDNKLAMAVRADIPVLAGILQKGLDSIAYEDMDRIRQQWLSLKIEPLADPRFIRQVLVPGAVLLVVVLAALAVVFHWNRRLRREIAERKRAEAEKRQFQNQLAHVGRLSTMGEMAAGFAHELNQPLAAIGNFASGCRMRLMTGDAEAPAIAAALDRIVHEAQRGGAIIRRIRQFVKKLDPETVPVAVGELFDEVRDLMDAEARQGAIVLSVELPNGLPRVMADPVSIHQVLVNLVRNGMDAVGELPPPRRHVAMTARVSESGRVRLSVRDEGRGMSEAIRARLFEPFLSTKAHGIGMGLSIARSIVEAHGGTLEVQSEEDRGTHAWFDLAAEPAKGT